MRMDFPCLTSYLCSKGIYAISELLRYAELLRYTHLKYE